MSCARGHPQPDVPVGGALAQLQHHPIGEGHLAEMGGGAVLIGAADEQLGRQQHLRRRGVREALGLEDRIEETEAKAAAQLLPPGRYGSGERRREPAELAAGVARQDDLAKELDGGPGEDGDRAPTMGAGALVDGVAAVAVQALVAPVGLERPAEEFRTRCGVLGDQQYCADACVAAGGVQIGQGGGAAEGDAVAAVAAIGGGIGVGAGVGKGQQGIAIRLSVALGREALGDQQHVAWVKGMAQLPDESPAVAAAIGMGADHREGRGGIERVGVDGGCKGAEGAIQLHADAQGFLAGPHPAAWSKHLGKHLIRHGAMPPDRGAPGSLVRSSRPWLPRPSHSLPSPAMK